MKTNYPTVNILKYDQDNGKLYFTDNEDADTEVTEKTLTGEVYSNNLYVWMAGARVEFISDIKVEEGKEHFFKKLPQAKYGGNVWIAKLNADAPEGTKIKYSISFKPKDKAIETIDPQIELRGRS